MPPLLSKQGAKLRAHSDDCIHFHGNAATTSSLRAKSPLATKRQSSTSSVNTRTSTSDVSKKESVGNKRVQALSNTLEQKIKDAMELCNSIADETALTSPPKHQDDISIIPQSLIPQEEAPNDWMSLRSKSCDHADLSPQPSITLKSKPPLFRSKSEQKTTTTRRHTISNPAAVVKDDSVNIFDEKQLPSVKHVFNHTAKGFNVASSKNATKPPIHPNATTKSAHDSSITKSGKPTCALELKIQETLRLCEQMSLQTLTSPESVASTAIVTSP